MSGTTKAIIRRINFLNSIRMNEQARENAAQALRQSLKDKQQDIDVLEGDLTDLVLELNYSRDKEERSEIHQRILTDEERMRDLQHDLQGLFDQLYSVTGV